MSITICDTHLVRTVRYLSLTFEPVYLMAYFVLSNMLGVSTLIFHFMGFVVGFLLGFMVKEIAR